MHLRGLTKQNGCGRSPFPPFSIYKIALAYNEKHYLPPRYITQELWSAAAKNDLFTPIVFLHRGGGGGVIYLGTGMEINHSFALR